MFTNENTVWVALKENWVKLLFAIVSATTLCVLFHNWPEIFVPIVAAAAIIGSVLEYTRMLWGKQEAISALEYVQALWRKKQKEEREAEREKEPEMRIARKFLLACLSITYLMVLVEKEIYWLFVPVAAAIALSVWFGLFCVAEEEHNDKRTQTDFKEKFLGICQLWLGFCWFGGGLFFLALIHRPDNSAWVFLLMSVTWGYDLTANIVGRLIGNKIFRKRDPPFSMSPKKSVEGTIAGVLATVPISYIPISFYDLDLGPGWPVLAILFGCVTMLGDLLGSLIKRAHGKKDFGKILPGHGGILDRFNGFLLTAIAFFAFVAIWLRPIP